MKIVAYKNSSPQKTLTKYIFVFLPFLLQIVLKQSSQITAQIKESVFNKQKLWQR